MKVPLAAVIVSACLPGTAAAQSPAANLTRQQRELLHAIVVAVDGATSQPETADLKWQSHTMRASDGSHYVAFSAEPPASAALPAGPVILYVRLATATPPGATTIVERSPIREWLAGSRVDPRLLPRRGTAMGEMPAFGAGAIAARGTTTSPSATDLRLMEFERQRAKEQQEDRDAKRRAALDGREDIRRDVLPFEDFDLASHSTRADGKRHVSRAFTAGPGDYLLHVAWTDPAAAKPGTIVHVVKKRLTLPPAPSTELTIGSVILADGIKIRTAPYQPSEQASHPYAIGLTEILPSADAHFADSENLSAVFQVINASGTETGKPNVDVAFEVVRLVNSQEQPVATLTPQNYSQKNLPAEFDLRAGHPLFATVSAPLTTLRAGAYRLKILVTDRLAGHTAAASTNFTVAATAASLLRLAPPLGQPFRRESILAADVLPGLLASLRPASPSPALQRAFDLAGASRFVDLMVEEPVNVDEEGARAALRGLAQLAVGDAGAAVQFLRAQQLGASAGVTRVLFGAARAAQSRDAEAILAWQEAIAAGAPRALVAPYLLDAYLRRGDYARAAASVADITASGWSRGTVAVLIATQKEHEAIPLLEARLAAVPGDADAHWLLLQSLFSQLVRNPGAPAAARERFVTLARAYVDAKGANSVLAGEWLALF